MKNNPRKILMISESAFPADIRPKNEAYTLIDAGYEVLFIAIQKADEKLREDICGVRVYRIPQLTLFTKARKPASSFIQKYLNYFKAVAGYIGEYCYFTASSFMLSLYLLIAEGFDVVHLHNPPDTLVLIASFYKLFGKKIVFDHHDLSPDLYQTRYSQKVDFIYNLLFIFEKLSCRIADVVICTNNSFKQIDMKRHNILSDKIHIVRNNPVIAEFEKEKKNLKLKQNAKINLLFLGAINPQDGLDNLLNILYYLVNNLNYTEFICNIVGFGDSLKTIQSMTCDLKLADYVDFKGRVTDRRQVIEHLYTADICLEPASENFLNHHSTFIKVMEYMMAAKPIVAFDLKETRYSTNGSAILIKPGDIEGFAGALIQLIKNPDLRSLLGGKARKRILSVLNWDQSSRNLLEAYKQIELPDLSVNTSDIYS